MNLKQFLLATLLFLCAFAKAYSQERKEIDITSDISQIDPKYPDAFIMYKDVNQVYIVHEGIEMWCDVALHYNEENFVRALGNVRMKQGDSVSMRSRYAEYNGDTQFAFAAGNVRLQKDTTTVTTDTLFFDRVKQQAYYRTGGVVKNPSSTIKSRIGRYFMEADKFTFLSNVTITNPEYVIESQQLDFYNQPEHAYFYGPTTITGENSVVYCERGFYDTKEDFGYFVKNSRIDYDNRTVKGDSLYFNRARNFASATNNIRVIDTANNSLIKGHYAEVFKDKDSVFITKRAVAITAQENDSIYMHADRLLVTGKPDNRIIRGYYDARIFKSDMSGKADSIHVNQKSGLTQMIRNPIIWSGESQMTGDSIHIISNPETEKLDSLKVFENAFIVQRDTLGYNQVKGVRLSGLFNEENELYQVDIDQNAESINYIRDEEGKLQGIDKGKSGSIRMLFEDQEISEIRKIRQVDGQIYPLSMFPDNARQFEGLVWRGDERPKTKEDIFGEEEEVELIEIEGIPLPTIEEDFFDNERSPEELNIPEASELSPKDFKNREEDAPTLGIPANDKATIRKDSIFSQRFPANFKPVKKATDTIQDEN
ncbi:OstA-like protein [Croceiramulus getboli]|nr:OstA-like protein [Flavobacteriaceae bacterium YJPT1-3]